MSSSPLIRQEILPEIISLRIVKNISWVGVSTFGWPSGSRLLSKKCLRRHLLFYRVRESLLYLRSWFRAIADTAVISSIRFSNLRIDVRKLYGFNLLFISFNLVYFLVNHRLGLLERVVFYNTLVSLLVGIVIACLMLLNVIVGYFNDDVEWNSLLRVKTKGVLFWNSKNSMHSIRANFLLLPQYLATPQPFLERAKLRVREIRGLLSYRNVNIWGETFVYFLNHRL